MVLKQTKQGNGAASASAAKCPGRRCSTLLFVSPMCGEKHGARACGTMSCKGINIYIQYYGRPPRNPGITSGP